MSQGNDFANYGSQDADTASSDGLWYVAVATDDIKTMTLEQLDDAFRLGVITGDTSVWTDGMEAWAPLKVVADLDGSAPDSEESEEASIEDEETHHAPGPVHGAGPQSPTHAPRASALNNPFASPVSLAPAVHASPFGMVVESSGPSSSLSPFGLSTAPVALEVDDEELPVRAARRWHPERWAIGAVALGALAFALVRNDVFASTPATEQQPVAAAAMNTQVTGLALNATKSKPVGYQVGDEEDQAEEKAEPAAAKAESAKEEPKAKEEKAAAADDESEAEATKPAAGLKGSVADALRKKPDAKRNASILKKPKASKKLARASKSKSSKRVSAAAKTSTKGGGSAFDPLNGDL